MVRGKKSYRLFERYTIAIQLTVCRTARVPESTVRVLIPIFCAGEVGIGTIRPKDWPNILRPPRRCERLGCVPSVHSERGIANGDLT